MFIEHSLSLSSTLMTMSTTSITKGTSFDDFGLEQLGRHVPGLLTLNVARTRVTDRGLVELQV